MATGWRIRKRTEWNSPFHSIPFWVLVTTLPNSLISKCEKGLLTLVILTVNIVHGFTSVLRERRHSRNYSFLAELHAWICFEYLAALLQLTVCGNVGTLMDVQVFTGTHIFWCWTLPSSVIQEFLYRPQVTF